MLSHFGLASRGSDESSYARADTQPRARLTETGPGAELDGSCGLLPLRFPLRSRRGGTAVDEHAIGREIPVLSHVVDRRHASST
jgi:hypothetical protein